VPPGDPSPDSPETHPNVRQLKSDSFAAIVSTKFCNKQSNVFNFILSSSFVPQGSLGKPLAVCVSCRGRERRGSPANPTDPQTLVGFSHVSTRTRANVRFERVLCVVCNPITMPVSAAQTAPLPALMTTKAFHSCRELLFLSFFFTSPRFLRPQRSHHLAAPAFSLPLSYSPAQYCRRNPSLAPWTGA